MFSNFTRKKVFAQGNGVGEGLALVLVFYSPGISFQNRV